MTFQQLIASNKGFLTFAEQFKQGKNGHAYLFECKDTILYKQLLLSCAAVAIGATEGTESFDRLMRGVIPDVMFFPTENKDKMSVADVSQIIDQSFMSPMYAEKKVFCIDASNSTREEWQNKLLKILEEPPQKVVFLIVCTNAEELLLTLKSRCQTISIGDFSTQQIADFLNKNGIYTKKAEDCAELSQGSVGKAKYIADNPNYLGCVDDMCKMLANMKSSKQISEYIPIVTKYKSFCTDMLEILENIFADVIRIKTNSQYILNLSKKDDIIQISGVYTEDAVWRCILAIENAKSQLDNYEGFLSVMDGLLLKLLEVKYKCRL